jgi:hypothetical protein
MNTDVKTMIATARVPLSAPRRYLGQLCKHFAHKIEANWAEDYSTGHIAFPMGSCDLAADEVAGKLVMQVSAVDEEDLARLEGVVARHLERFAFREPLTVTWTRA